MLTMSQITSDNRKMKQFIGERISPDGTSIVLADGGDGPAWVDLIPLWNEEGECDLVLDTNEPDAFGLREVYDHFRRKELTGWEWERELAAERNRWKVRKLERENAEMLRHNGSLASGALDTQLDGAVTHELARVERKLEEKLDKIAALLTQQKTIKDWYSTAEVAERLSRAEFTVREWCRLGHCKAEKKKPYRGGKKQWMIPHDELLKLESDGPAPLGTYHSQSSRN